MPNSVNFRRELRMVLLEQVDVQKTFPEVHTIFRVSNGNPESRHRISLGLGIIKGLWEECILPGSKTPRLVEAQGLYALALSTWKKDCRSEYR